MLDVSSLVDRCREGDALAWEALVRRLQGRVFALALHYMKDREEARDMAQEIFIRLWERLDTFEGGERFLPWLVRLSRNLCLDRLRRIKARPPAFDVPLDAGAEIVATDPGPDSLSAEESRRRLLYRAIDEMGDRGREIILLKEIQELPVEEIAHLLAVPVGTVKSRSNRARLELAERLRRLDPSFGT